MSVLFDFILGIFPVKKYESEGLYMRWAGLALLGLIILNNAFLWRFGTICLVLNVVLGLWVSLHALFRIMMGHASDGEQ